VSAAFRLRGHDAVLVIDNSPVVIFRTSAGLSVIARIRYIRPDQPLRPTWPRPGRAPLAPNNSDDGMIHDVSIPAALIAGLVSFLSPCVLPLVPPYLIYLTGATIEHVANAETDAASRRAVMISAVMFVLGFSTVFVALGASASLIGGLIRAWSAELSIAAGYCHHHHGPALPRPDPDRVFDAGRAVADSKAGRPVGSLCDGLPLRSAGRPVSARSLPPSSRSPPPRRR